MLSAFIIDEKGCIILRFRPIFFVTINVLYLLVNGMSLFSTFPPPS